MAQKIPYSGYDLVCDKVVIEDNDLDKVLEHMKSYMKEECGVILDVEIAKREVLSVGSFSFYNYEGGSGTDILISDCLTR